MKGSGEGGGGAQINGWIDLGKTLNAANLMPVVEFGFWNRKRR